MMGQEETFFSRQGERNFGEELVSGSAEFG